MVALRNLMIIYFGLFVLAHCNTNKGNPTFSSSVAFNSSLVGQWKYNNTGWYASELTLHKDGTFAYHDQGCYGQRFSQGQWTSVNGSIFMTSFDTFKQKEQVDVNKIVEVTKQNKPRRKLKKGEVEYSFVGFKEKPTLSFPSAEDTVRVYLNNLQLQLRNDTLYCVGANKLPEDAKFYRTKNKL